MRVIHPRLRFHVRGSGCALPGEAISNTELLMRHQDTCGLSPAVIHGLAARLRESYGLKNRHLAHVPGTDFADGEETAESLASKAVGNAIGASRGIEAFILGSTTSRRYSGSQATAVLGNFGITAPAYEMKVGCSTSLAGLHSAFSLLSFGYPNVLIACAETLSKVADPANRESWLGLADGAAALWLDSKEGEHCFEATSCVFSTDGALVDLYTTPADLPPTPERAADGGYFLKGDAVSMRKHAFAHYAEMIDTLLPERADRSSIDWIIPHQVSQNLIEEVVSEKGLAGKLIWDADEIGNIGGASVLYSVARAISSGRFEAGQRILLMSVGGGLSCAAQVWDVIN